MGLGRRLCRVADGRGIQGAGLGGVRAVKSPPAPTTIAHGVLVGWSAARAEHRGRTWQSARELELDRERWAAPTRCERGYTEQLPDLAVWIKPSKAPGAVIAESGGRREDRQKMILEGWRDALWSEPLTSAVPYYCTSPSVARWDHAPGQQGRPDRSGLHRRRANDRRADRRPPPRRRPRRRRRRRRGQAVRRTGLDGVRR